MHLKLKSLSGIDKDIEIDGSSTILELKNLIYKTELIPPEQQRLVCGGHVLGKDTHTLSQCRVKSDNVIHLILALRGG